MNWTRTGVLLLVLVLGCSALVDAQVKKGSPGKSGTGMKIKYVHPQDTSYLGISRAKDSFIQQTIKAHIDAGEDISNNAVAKAIMSDVASEIEMNPKKSLDTRSTKVLMELARKQIEKQFPKSLEQLKKELTAEAEKRFVQYKLRDRITVKYYRGPKILAVSGPFYAFNGRTVKIGSRIIPYYDVVPEDKIKIDKKYSDAKRTEFIAERYNRYRDRRSDALTQAFNKLKDAQEAANEKAGYINVLDRWFTAAQLTENYIEKERIRASSSNKSNSFDDKEILVFDTPNENQLIAKINENRTKLNSLKGIDSDWGYAPAAWDFTRGEARLALQYDNYSVLATKDYDYFITPNRLIRNIQFDYINNKLSRVITFYTRVTLQDFVKLKEQFVARYGKDDLQRDNPREAAKDRLRSLIWTGKYTIAKLMLNFGEDDVVNGVLFIKEKAGAYSPKDSMVRAPDKKGNLKIK